MTIRFVIDGEPVAKGRPKFRMTSKFVQTYTPAKTKMAESHILDCFKAAYPDFKTPLDGPISLTVKFYMPMPTSISKKKQDALKSKPHLKRPDLDNLLKTVCDALNGYVWKDDSQVYLIAAAKAYSDYKGSSTVVEINNY